MTVSAADPEPPLSSRPDDPTPPGSEPESVAPATAATGSADRRAEVLRRREENRLAAEERRLETETRKKAAALLREQAAPVGARVTSRGLRRTDTAALPAAEEAPALQAVAPAEPGAAPPADPALATTGEADATLLRQPVGAAQMQRRHYGIMLSLLLVVVLPFAVSGWYLWTRATDQYASTLGFSVHREDVSSALSVISGLSSLSGTASADTDVIYRYIFSQQVVQEIQDEVNLRAIWSKPQNDPVFAFDDTGSIEDLVKYWSRMVKVYYDSTTHLIEVRVLAFDPIDAQRIAQAIYEKSTAMINRLNDVATEDSVRLAREELELTLSKLVAARQAMTTFRNANQIVDPAADVAAQASILASLQQELASTLIDYDLLNGTVPKTDPRIGPLERRIEVIENRIKAERGKLGAGDGGAYADIVAEYEKLKVDLEFAEASYNAARAAYDAAQAEARQQSRYLAAHVLPTLAESSRYPERPVLLAVIGGLLFLVWAIGTLVFYSFRDRR